MDLKMIKEPKALSNKAGTVFLKPVTLSKHFRDMTSGTKLQKMIKEHV